MNTITATQLGKTDVLSSLRNFQNKDRQEYYGTDRLKKKERRKQKANIPPSAYRNDLSSVTWTLVLWMAALGRLQKDWNKPFWALQYHTEAKRSLAGCSLTLPATDEVYH